MEVLTKREALRHRLAAARNVQAIYMPPVPLLVARHLQTLKTVAPEDPPLAGEPTEVSSSTASTAHVRTTRQTTRQKKTAVPNDPGDYPEAQPLFLPSAFPMEELDQCTPGLPEIESRLREGQLRDSLDKLRVHLHIKSRLVVFKNRHVRHQRPNTRARAKINANEARIIFFADKYRRAWVAKEALDGPGDWQRQWRELKMTDVRCMKEGEVHGERVSEGSHEISWIWMSADGTGDGMEASNIAGLNQGAWRSTPRTVD